MSLVEVSEATLERLSFDRVRSAVADRAGTFMGAELAKAVNPGVGVHEALAMHDRIGEIVTGGDLTLGGIEDIRPFLQRVRDGGLLDGLDILAVAYTLDGAATLRRSVAASQRPALTELASRIGTFDGVLRQVREQLDVDGKVRDDATPKLQDIRRRLNPLRGRIRDRLSRILESHGDDVQEPIITLRRDRYVIPVKAYAQSRVPGLALDRSDSGATVFIEPASVVPLNNELALLEMEERDEVRRVLYALGRSLADVPGVDESLAVVAELDMLNAGARLAKDWRLVRPRFDDAGRARLIDARHPLVEGCVPNTIELDAEQRVLIVTGPNAGGKTVLLKTLGLAAVMAYSGLFVAADGTRPALVPRLEALLSDIGDQQSIEASLSTYAGHLANLKAIVESSGPTSLVLIDELGSGTDPDEGAALSQAILERIIAGGARGLITTHLAPLKVFASQADGVRNAAMRFDVELLRPTYQLVVGQPGRSYALSIAERIGLDEELLERAAEILGPDSGRLESLLMILEQQREELEAEVASSRAAGELALAEAELLREQIQSLRAREQEVLAAAAQKAEGMLSDTLQQATRLRRTATQEPAQRSKALEEIQELRRQARRLSGAASRGGAEGPSGGGGTRAGQGSLGAQAAGSSQAVADGYAPGARVRVESYGADGQVLERRGEQLLVQLGLLKVEVPLADATPVVQRPSKPAPGPDTRSRGGRNTPGATRRVQLEPGAASFESELNIRGERVEQALEKTRDFISEARALKVESVRILHGKGTGVLRDAIRSFLKNDRNVLSYEDAVPYEGGHGVTVAHLRP